MALQEEAREKRRVAEALARKEREDRQKGKKGKRPPPKKEPPRKKLQPQRSLVGKNGEPTGELGRIYMAAPKDKNLAMLPSQRLPVRKLAPFVDFAEYTFSQHQSDLL